VLGIGLVCKNLTAGKVVLIVNGPWMNGGKEACVFICRGHLFFVELTSTLSWNWKVWIFLTARRMV
jgi:hypothetical protein